ncbi:HAD-IIIA family hydrolase [Pontibacter sp. XAAS-A31]|nr:HAD-IIIA family hydrolase [Pontibacter harenae]
MNLKIENGYVLKPSDIEILPGITEFLAWAKEKFKQIIVVTNQRCVGRELLTLEALNSINNEINDRTGSNIDKFYVCPHLVEDACSCRKPKNGMFLKAAAEFDIRFEASWMVGDSETDLIPAEGLGINTIFISANDSLHADVRVNSTTELLAFFEALEQL